MDHPRQQGHWHAVPPGCEGFIDFCFRCGVQNEKLLSECLCGRFRVARLGFGLWIARVHQHRYKGRAWNKFMQKAEAFSRKLGTEPTPPGNISLRPAYAGD